MENFNELPTEGAVAWIDPLDGTRDFTRGNLKPVTSIVGITVKGVSRVGVVHKPVTYANEEVGESYFGTLECGGFKMSFDPLQPEGRKRGDILPLTTFD